MNKDKRVARAQEEALEYFDYLIETRPAPDFVEIVGCIGGDVLTRRFYDDGTVTAK